MTIVVVAVSLIVIVVAIALFAPIFLECPGCEIRRAVEEGSSNPPSAWSLRVEVSCEWCWKGRISVFNRCLNPNSPYPGSTFTIEK